MLPCWFLYWFLILYVASMQCQAKSGGCAGSDNNCCHPHHYWAGLVSSDKRHANWFDTGVSGGGLYSFRNAHSVRCALCLEAAVCSILLHFEMFPDAVFCIYLQQYCLVVYSAGSYNGRCYPYPVWSSTSAGGVDYYNQEYMGGSFTTSLVRACTYAFSVRCRGCIL